MEEEDHDEEVQVDSIDVEREGTLLNRQPLFNSQHICDNDM